MDNSMARNPLQCAGLRDRPQAPRLRLAASAKPPCTKPHDLEPIDGAGRSPAAAQIDDFPRKHQVARLEYRERVARVADSAGAHPR